MTDRSGPVYDGPVDRATLLQRQADYPNYQDELGSWLSSLTGVHISKKGVSIGGGLANLPHVTLSQKSSPAPMPVPRRDYMMQAPVQGGMNTTLLLGAAALVVVMMMKNKRGT